MSDVGLVTHFKKCTTVRHTHAHTHTHTHTHTQTHTLTSTPDEAARSHAATSKIDNYNVHGQM